MRTGWKTDDIIALCYKRGETIPGFEVLHHALREKNLRALDWLLTHGGDANSCQVRRFQEHDEWGSSLLEVAVAEGYLEGTELLLRRGAVLAPEMVEAGFLSIKSTAALARLLLVNGPKIDLNHHDKRDETLLWKVCSGLYQGNERAALVALLIENGAGVQAAPVDTGTTPLMFASALGNTDVVSLLLQAGADPQTKDTEGRTALDFARKRGNTKAVELLQGV